MLSVILLSAALALAGDGRGTRASGNNAPPSAESWEAQWDESEAFFLDGGELRQGRLVAPAQLTVPQAPAPQLELPPPVPPAPADVEGSPGADSSQGGPAASQAAEAASSARGQPTPVDELFSDEFGLDPIPVQTLPRDVYDRALLAINTEFDGIPGPPEHVGTQYAPFAPFLVEPAQPRTHLRLRYDNLLGIDRPDRSEYLWKRIDQGGPSRPEQNVEFKQFSIYSETGTDRAAGFLQMSVIGVNPDINHNSAGLGNLLVGTKAVLLDGADLYWISTEIPDDHWQLSLYFGSGISLATSAAPRGITHGHFTLTPGLLTAYHLSPNTVFHGQLKFTIPMGGTPDFSGEVVEYGLALSHVVLASHIDSPACDHIALIPTLEFNAVSFLDGQQTTSRGFVEPVDAETGLGLATGIRCVINERVDLGFLASRNITGSRYYREMYRFEIRWYH